MEQLIHAFGIELIHINGGVDDVILEGGEVAREFEGASRAHGVPDKAFGVVDVGAG